MGIYGQTQRYNNVIPLGTTADVVSIPVMSDSFNVIQFSIVTDANANFNVRVYKSNQDLPPDPTKPRSITNQFDEVAYTDEGDITNYTASVPFNPSGSEVAKTFNIDTAGARWIFIAITDYSAGTLEKCDVSLFNNIL